MNEVNYKCPRCGTSISIDVRGRYSVSWHLVKQHSFSKEDAHLEYVKVKYSLTDKDIDNIIKAYGKGKSYPILREETGLTLVAVYKILKAKGAGRTKLEAAQGAKSARENTCILRYGRDNVSKLKETKNKKEQTFLEHYGVNNVFKTEQFKTDLNKHMIEKYGVKRILSPALHSFKPKTEDQVEEILRELDIPYSRSFYLKGRQYDFLLLNTKLIIEVNGDFWHANPAKYKAEDVLPQPKRNITAQALWDKDLAKKQLAESCGYRVIPIWELDLKTKTKVELRVFIQSEYFRSVVKPS